jgi:hypothetical protein
VGKVIDPLCDGKSGEIRMAGQKEENKDIPVKAGIERGTEGGYFLSIFSVFLFHL